MRQRTVAITARLASELESLFVKANPQPDELVFGITDNFHEAFTSACKKAGLDDLRYHDLRHVAATRLIQAGLPREQVGRILGHTQANTTYRYINVDNEAIRRAASLLDVQQAESEEREAVN
jgi:integrase